MLLNLKAILEVFSHECASDANLCCVSRSVSLSPEHKVTREDRSEPPSIV